MHEDERREIIKALKAVDEVVLTNHRRNPEDMSVCAELRALRPNIFGNGGDRTRKSIPEVSVCKELSCRTVFNLGKGGKVQSSSWLLSRYALRAKKM